MADEGWARLGKRVAVERGRHWRSRAAFAHAAGLSPRLVGDIENGRRSNYSDATLAAIEAVLGWAPGTCLRVVQGGKVRRDIDLQTMRMLDAWSTLPSEARELLIELAERANRTRR